VRNVLDTRVESLHNVVFYDHSTARKAFTTQRDMCLRMIPPRKSDRNWLRSPAPKFIVKFETMKRLLVRNGRARKHEAVGELLMSDSKNQRGCLIWANQIKGHRIRIVGCKGKFLLPSGRVVDMNEVPSINNENNPLGWLSYRCRYTKEEWVKRLSKNNLRDYIFVD